MLNRLSFTQAIRFNTVSVRASREAIEVGGASPKVRGMVSVKLSTKKKLCE